MAKPDDERMAQDPMNELDLSPEERTALDALDHVVREAQDCAPLDLDWERVEARLMTRIAACESGRFEAPVLPLDADDAANDSRRPPTRYRIWTALAVAAAVLVAGLFALKRPPEASPTTTAQNAGEVLDGDRLEVGRLIKSEGAPVVVEHAGRATWTLGPGGRARLVSTGRYLTVRLEQGVIDASVVPRHLPESFAIQAGETRIAVRGTQFRVDLQEQHAKVDVAHGTVVVGLAGEPGDTDGWVLRAPAAGEFSLDGAKRGANLEGNVDAPTVAAEPVVGPIEPTSRPVGPRPTSDLSLDGALEQLSAASQTCFVKETPEVGGVRVSASTQLKLAVTAEGKLDWLSFEPPLSPAVESCVRARMAGVQVKPGSAREAARRVTLGQRH
ncbi:MAG: FecR domain-containing protein [Myxococcales bacterium]|nr:FecR domain-containing protein [Myxococcales bacterium]